MINIDQSNNCIIETIWRDWKNYYPWRLCRREIRLSNAYLSNLDLNLKAGVRYFSLFLKEQCSFWLFRTKYFEKKFNLQLFYLPIVS